MKVDREQLAEIVRVLDTQDITFTVRYSKNRAKLWTSPKNKDILSLPIMKELLNLDGVAYEITSRGKVIIRCEFV